MSDRHALVAAKCRSHMFEYQFDPSRRLMTCHASGRTELSEVIRLLQHALDQITTLNEFTSLLVIEDTAAFLSWSDVRALRPLSSVWRDGRCRGRWAVVVPNQATLVMAQLVARQLDLGLACFNCFLSRRDAEIWLATGQLPKPLAKVHSSIPGSRE